MPSTTSNEAPSCIDFTEAFHRGDHQEIEHAILVRVWRVWIRGTASEHKVTVLESLERFGREGVVVELASVRLGRDLFGGIALFVCQTFGLGDILRSVKANDDGACAAHHRVLSELRLGSLCGAWRVGRWFEQLVSSREHGS